jgi:hypothetical protein
MPEILFTLHRSFLPTTSRSPLASIGTELLAAGEEIEVTRNGAPFEHSPVPMSRAIDATHGLLRTSPESASKLRLGGGAEWIRTLGTGF